MSRGGAAILALALLAGCVFGLWKIGAGFVEQTASHGSASSSPRAQSTFNAYARRTDAVDDLFRKRSQAVLTRDRRAFMQLLDENSLAFRARQSQLFDQLAKVPLASWSYDVNDTPNVVSRRSQLPRGAWIVRVTLHYTFEGSTSAVDRIQYFTLVPGAAGWLLAEDRDARAYGLNTQRDVWDQGVISVVRGRKSLVIGEATSSALRPLALVADDAVENVSRVWPRRWAKSAVVIVPRSQADMATLLEIDQKGLSQIAAVTTGHAYSGRTRGDRVVVNPAAWPQLTPDGQKVVMTHEVTHLATRASTYRALPMWMSEGFSDYVAYGAVDVSERRVAKELLDLVRAGELPETLPADGEFDAALGDLGPAYEGAWLVCRMIAETYGEDKLVELYLALSDRTVMTLDDDLRNTLGISHARLVADWQAQLRALATP